MCHLNIVNMVADILTKPLPREDWYRLRAVLLGQSPIVLDTAILDVSSSPTAQFDLQTSGVCQRCIFYILSVTLFLETKCYYVKESPIYRFCITHGCDVQLHFLGFGHFGSTCSAKSEIQIFEYLRNTKIHNSHDLFLYMFYSLILQNICPFIYIKCSDIVVFYIM